MFTILIVKRKNVGLSKKVMPIWLYLLFGLGIMIIQMKHPELVITIAMESLVCCLMYFTIENPNFKTPVIALTADAVAGAVLAYQKYSKPIMKAVDNTAKKAIKKANEKLEDMM